MATRWPRRPSSSRSSTCSAPPSTFAVDAGSRDRRTRQRRSRRRRVCLRVGLARAEGCARRSDAGALRGRRATETEPNCLGNSFSNVNVRVGHSIFASEIDTEPAEPRTTSYVSSTRGWLTLGRLRGGGDPQRIRQRASEAPLSCNRAFVIRAATPTRDPSRRSRRSTIGSARTPRAIGTA